MELNFNAPEDYKHWLRHYQMAIDVNIITSITDNKGTIIYVNDKFCDVSGYSRKELIGNTHSLINSNYHSKDFFKDMWITIKNGTLWSGEIRNKTKDNNYYWVDTVIVPINVQGNIQYLSLRMLITEKKEFESRALEYVESLEKLLMMVSHEVRAPVASILGLVQLDYSTISEKDFQKITTYLKKSAVDLDLFTKKLNLRLIEIKEKMEKKAT